MTSRQQLARLLPLALLILLGIAGLHGGLAAPRWDGPLRAYGVVIGLALEVIFGALLVITVRRGKAASPLAASAADEEGRADVPGRLRLVLTWLLSLSMIAVAVLLLASLHLHLFSKAGTLRPPPVPRPVTIRPQPAGKAAPGAPFPIGPILWGLLIALLVAAVAVSIWWASRQRRPATAGRLPGSITEDEDREGLREAVSSGRAALAALDDAREAIIACYSAMEETLARRGTARRIGDTPDELLGRAVTAGILHGPAGGAAGKLTTLFYEARFSSHRLGQAQRDAAAAALGTLAAGLAAPSGQPGPAAATGSAGGTGTAGGTGPAGGSGSGP